MPTEEELKSFDYVIRYIGLKELAEIMPSGKTVEQAIRNNHRQDPNSKSLELIFNSVRILKYNEECEDMRKRVADYKRRGVGMWAQYKA